MKRVTTVLALGFYLAIGMRDSAFPQVPSLINYQGRLLNGTNLVNGSVGLTLRLYNQAAGGVLLFEDSNTVAVTDGLYTTFLGDNVTAGSLDTALTNGQVWLETRVNNTTLSPRERVASVPYAQAVRGLFVDENRSVTLNLPTASNRIANSTFTTIGGGYKNRVEFGSYSVIAGGDQNLIEGGGWYNTISGGSVSEILGGAQAATIGGGFDHYVPGGGDYATIPGGLRNAATNHAFAAGRRAKALNTGAFVWGDATDADVSSTANNQVTFRASGGFRVLNGELLVEQGLRVSNAGTVFARVQAGTTTLGPGTNTMSYVVAFPSAFVTAPKVQVTPRNDPLFDVPDTFATTLRKVTTTNFVVNIHRVDAPAGWAQQLRLDWTAWE